MTNDDDWVQHVKRWYFAGIRSAVPAAPDITALPTEPEAMGYEAAHPSLQPMHWPETASPALGPTP